MGLCMGCIHIGNDGADDTGPAAFMLVIQKGNLARTFARHRLRAKQAAGISCEPHCGQVTPG